MYGPWSCCNSLHRAIRSQMAELHQQTRLLLRLGWLCRLLWFKNLHLHLKTHTASSDSVRCNHIVHVDVWMLVTHLLEHDLVSVPREPLNHRSIKILTKIFCTVWIVGTWRFNTSVACATRSQSRVFLRLSFVFQSLGPGDQTCITTVTSMILSVCWACGSCVALQLRHRRSGQRPVPSETPPSS